MQLSSPGLGPLPPGSVQFFPLQPGNQPPGAASSGQQPQHSVSIVLASKPPASPAQHQQLQPAAGPPLMVISSPTITSPAGFRPRPTVPSSATPLGLPIVPNPAAAAGSGPSSAEPAQQFTSLPAHVPNQAAMPGATQVPAQAISSGKQQQHLSGNDAASPGEAANNVAQGINQQPAKLPNGAAAP